MPQRSSFFLRICLACGLFAVFWFCPAHQVFCESGPVPAEVPADVKLEPIVVSARRAPVPKSRTAEDILVLTLEKLSATTADNLGETLDFVPVVDIDLRGKFGQPTSVSIQGSESRQVLIMIDEIPFNTQLSGQVNPANIPAGNIGRIEIIPGPASSSWGSSLGGVMQAVTGPKALAFSISPKV